MMLYTNPRFMIYFGDAHDKLTPAFYLDLPQYKPILEIEPFAKLKTILHLKYLMFLHQIHSDQGMVINQRELDLLHPFKKDGDFLITNLKNVGIGIMTGDCLPIIFYDRVHNLIAITHAGWRGSVLGVAVKTLECMYEKFGTKNENVEVFFGPSIKVCCCEVSSDFRQNLAGFEPIDRFITQKEGKFYFDLPKLNRVELQAAGIKEDAFHMEYNFCTKCDPRFYSYRRQGESAGRQMTVVSLV